MSNKIFAKGVKLIGSVTQPDSDLQQAILYAFVNDDGKGLTILHHPDLTPQTVIELGEKITEIGRRLQQ